MKKLVLAAMGMVLSGQALALDTYSLKCKSQAEGKALDFVFSPDTDTVTVTDAEYLGYAQILTDVPFGADIAPTKIAFSYDWYYTADYSLTLSAPYYEDGQVEMKLTYDDSDGAFEDDVAFSCVAKKL